MCQHWQQGRNYLLQKSNQSSVVFGGAAAHRRQTLGRFPKPCTMLREQPQELLKTLRQTAPLVQCIQNGVAMDISANAMLAIGASPAMVRVTLAPSSSFSFIS